ncbi:MAG: aldose 1-epimerase [Reyranellales bacterium]
MTLLLMRAGRLAVDLVPQSGGAIARFCVDGADILRPMTAADVASGKGNNASAYPLVPFSNRIANGRLAFGEEHIQLETNWPGQRHPMHGDGWARPWSVVQSDAHSAELVYEHDGKRGWPFRYRARQSYRLGGEALAVGMSIDNLEGRTVPAGLGLHPFFVREPDTELACRTKGVWRADAEVLPVERIAVPPEWDFTASRRIDDLVLDNCFDGWDGRAIVSWPRRKLRLELAATEPFRHLVVYIPRERPFFCVEPVSHANGQLGASRLAPGATLAGEIVFRVSNM